MGRGADELGPEGVRRAFRAALPVTAGGATRDLDRLAARAAGAT